MDSLNVNSFIALASSFVPALLYVIDGSIDSEDFSQSSFVILKETISGDEAEVVLSGVISFGEKHLVSQRL